MTWRKGDKRTAKGRQMASPPLEIIAHRRNKAASPMVGPNETSSPPRSLSTSASSTGSVRQFPKEVDDAGRIEHKFRLIGIPKERLEHLRTQMKWRVEEGRGEAIYRIGVLDNGDALGICQEDLDESLDTLVRVAQPLKFDVEVLEVFEGIVKGHNCAMVAIRRANQTPADQGVVDAITHEVRVAVVGAFGTGKSSIIGYLTTGVKDDGKGKTARSVAVHKHEIRIGRTSSFSSHQLRSQTSASSMSMNAMKGVENIFCDMDLDHDLVESKRVPSKIVSLIDTGGHPKALSSCLRGLSACCPDYFLLCLDLPTARGENAERLGVAMDFLRLAQRANIPYAVAVTKCDDEKVLATDSAIMNQFGDLVTVDLDTVEETVALMPVKVPLVLVSSVTGEGMDCLTALLNALPRNHLPPSPLLAHPTCELEKDWVEPCVLGISRTFLLRSEDDSAEDEIGEEGLFGGERESDSASPSDALDIEDSQRFIVIGVILSGRFEVGQTLYIGPDRESGSFSQVKVASMRCASGAAVESAGSGSTVSLQLLFIDTVDGRKVARKGALVCNNPDDIGKFLTRTFDVSLNLSAAIDLRNNEELVAYSGAMSQACRVISLSRCDESSAHIATMQFVYRSDYLLRDIILFKRSDGSVVVGRIVRYNEVCYSTVNDN